MKRIMIKSEMLLPNGEAWVGFNVGSGDDFAQEVEATGQNAELIEFLAQRHGRREQIPLDEVRRQLE